MQCANGCGGGRKIIGKRTRFDNPEMNTAHREYICSLVAIGKRPADIAEMLIEQFPELSGYKPRSLIGRITHVRTSPKWAAKIEEIKTGVDPTTELAPGTTIEKLLGIIQIQIDRIIGEDASLKPTHSDETVLLRCVAMAASLRNTLDKRKNTEAVTFERLIREIIEMEKLNPVFLPAGKLKAITS